jgi:hypothetical protein
MVDSTPNHDLPDHDLPDHDLTDHDLTEPRPSPNHRRTP